jgi:hypothetical protein
MTPADESGGHEPKSTHRSRWGRFSPSMGWKAFWSEIIIVVLGVMIALAANEAVENWNWRKKVAAGELKLQREAATNFNFAAKQVAVAPCIAAQLDALQKRLLGSGDVLDPAPVFNDSFSGTFVYRIPNRPYVQSAWQAVNNGGTASHMDDWRQHMYAQLYSQNTDMVERTRTKTGVHRVRSLVLSIPIPLNQSTRALLLAELLEQNGHLRLQSGVAVQTMAVMRDLGQAPPSKIVQEFLQNESGTLAFCKAQGFPIADWQQLLDKEPVEAPF